MPFMADGYENEHREASGLASQLFDPVIYDSLLRELLEEYDRAQQFVSINQAVSLLIDGESDLGENIELAKAVMERISEQIAGSVGLTEAMARLINPGVCR